MLLVASNLKNNIEIEKIIPKDETEIFKKKLIQEKIKFHELAITRLSLKPNYILKYLIFSFFEIFKFIFFFKKQNYAVIQANSTPQFKAVIAAFILRLKIIWVIEDSYFPLIIVFIFRFLAKLTGCKIIYTSQRVYDFYFQIKTLNNKMKEIFAMLIHLNLIQIKLFYT